MPSDRTAVLIEDQLLTGIGNNSLSWSGLCVKKMVKKCKTYRREILKYGKLDMELYIGRGQ